MDFFNDANLLPWLIPAGPLLAFLIITLLTNRSKLVPATDHHEYGGHHPDYEGMMVPVVNRYSRVISVAVGLGWRHFRADCQLGDAGRSVPAASSRSRSACQQHRLDGHGRDRLLYGRAGRPSYGHYAGDGAYRRLDDFIYSIGYMAHDPRQARFFALISLFAGAMLTLVVADNVLLLFVGWEIMGVCSYLLIGFWFEKEKRLQSRD